MLPSRLFAIALLAIAPVLTIARAEAQSASTQFQRHIVITAEGTAEARPDQAIVRIGVSTNAKSAKAAVAANSSAMRPLIDALKAAGIDEKDVRTANFNLQPSYEYSQDGKPPKLVGYLVNNTVTVKVRVVEKLGDILDLAVSEGSNQVGGVSFIVSKADELKDEARKAAVSNATRMAKTYAAAAGVSLGDVLSISEGAEPREFTTMPAAMAPRSAAAAAPPIEAGSQELAAVVTMVWAIR